MSGSGENGGLSFDIWRKITEVKFSSSFNKGFKLVVHLPSEVPHFDKQYYRFPLEKSATLVIRPTLIDTEDNLVDHGPETRQCYFEKERKLKYFKRYTRSNCQMECLADFTLRKCKCIVATIPRFKGVKICNSEKSRVCYNDAKKEMMRENMETSLKTSNSYDDRGKLACDCLPACTSLSYEGEISHDDIRYFGSYKNSE